MKKITLFAIAFACFSFVSKAQIEKGNVMIGGNLGFSSTTSEYTGSPNSTSSTFSISPYVAKAYKNNRLAGISLTYRHYVTENKDLNTNGYGIAAFLRQYKPLGKSGFSLFAQESLNYNYNEYKQWQSGFPGPVINKYQFNNVNVALNPGFAYNLTSKMQLELLLNNLVSLGYAQNKSSTIINGTGTLISTDKNFYLNSEFTLSQLTDISVGLRFILGKK